MRKEFVRFSTSKSDEAYYSRDFNSKEMGLLGAFFTIDYPLYKFDRLIEWPEDPEFNFRQANITFIEKRGDQIVIGDL